RTERRIVTHRGVLVGFHLDLRASDRVAYRLDMLLVLLTDLDFADDPRRFRYDRLFGGLTHFNRSFFEWVFARLYRAIRVSARDFRVLFFKRNSLLSALLADGGARLNGDTRYRSFTGLELLFLGWPCSAG